MKLLLRLCGLCALLTCLPVWGQLTPVKVFRIDIRHIGPAKVSDELIRDNIRIKPGDSFTSPIAMNNTIDDDVRNLYATGLFYNVRVAADRATDGGLILVYIVQGRPTLTAIKIEGNKKYSDSKIKKKITSKVGEPLDERKLFSDTLAIRELYQKSGRYATTVTNTVNIDEVAGRGTTTFLITEYPKIKITSVNFIGAQHFTEKKLRKQIKTKKYGMFSWLTGRGKFKEDQFEQDRERLAEFYRSQGYIDFDIKDVKFENPTPTTMVIQISIYEGQQYKVGTVTFSGTTMLPTNRVEQAFKLKPGAVFVPGDLSKDIESVEDYYGARGHIDVTTATGDLQVKRVANTQTGTMDLKYKVNEGQASYIEKIDIRGNTKTKDRVIRRELAVSPGEIYNTVRVKISKKRLEGLNYFEKVDTRPEDTTIPNRKNLVVSVEEKNTGNISVGAGFSSVDALVGFAEVSQGNFDLFHPPTFTGGGQKIRLRVQLGTERQDYVLSFVEPWFLGRKLSLGVDFYYRDLDFQSVDDLYTETRAGIRVSLTRALWSDFLIGSVWYNIENVGIHLDNDQHGTEQILVTDGREQRYVIDESNTPEAILEESGYSLLSRVGFSLAYDTRNSTLLPDAGQRTEFSMEFTGGPLGGDKDFYKTELKSAWYIRGLLKGHVLELTGRTGIADSFNGSDVPFYERYYLGGLYSLRGFEYRGVSPRDPTYGINPNMSDEPIGGDTYWFGSAEYSIPVIEKEKMVGVRFALFYDIGNVMADPYDYQFGNYSDDWGIGLRLNLPIGPLRLDYAFPLQHDEFNSGNGRFQFGVGYTRGF